MSIEPHGAKRRILLEAVEVTVEGNCAILSVGGEPLLTSQTLEGALASVDLTLDDVEMVD